MKATNNKTFEPISPNHVSEQLGNAYPSESEVGNMVAQYGDWFSKEELKHVEDLKPGEGGVMNLGMKKVVVYRDEQSNLHTCSAICPHLGGVLQWNSDEKTFDCPMHGSRFTTLGKVINGPALSDLKRITIREEQTA